VPNRPGRAAGLVLNVMGQVLNLKGEPVRDAKVEIWQANTYGRYTHPSDHNTAPLDPNFDGSALLTADIDGRQQYRSAVITLAHQAAQKAVRVKWIG
jgi:protocatechuate 3,4-dioxygenase, beta subunit